MARNGRSAAGVIAVTVLGCLLTACTSTKAPPAPRSSPADAGPSSASSALAATSNASSTNSAASGSNVWTASVDPHALPLGDGHVSTTPKTGYVDSCTTTFRGGGARHAGSWLDAAAGTWDMTAKPAVEGSVTWPQAQYSATIEGQTRVISTNDLPEGVTSGTFPIARSDPAYRFDTNPNHLGADQVTIRLPVHPAPAATPRCTGLGPIGVLDDGVFLYNALDDAGRDAVAHETQDSCNGHPDGHERYHYHDVPVCIRDRAVGASTLVGYALDGYGIYVERDASGALPTNADLDACHGRTSPVMWDGTLVTMYHYDATLEYPYTVGCFHGTPMHVPVN